MRHLFPTLISDSRIDSYLLMLERIKNSETATFQLKGGTQLSPAGHAILCCLRDAAFERQCQVLWECPQTLLRRTPFLKQWMELRAEGLGVLPSPSAYDSETDTLLLVGRSNALDLGFMERIESKFPLSDDLLFDCRLILQELMQNSITHSGAERYFMYAGLWKGEIHLGVLDMGVGIPAKLRQKYRQPDDLDYLLLAMEEGVTTRRVRAGGLGLYHFRDFLRKNQGKLTIVSGNAQIRLYFSTRKSQKSLLKAYLPGTWCFARIPLPFIPKRMRHENSN